MTDHDERRQVMRQIDELEGRFRAEHERHQAATAQLRHELHALVARADELGVSVTSLSKALGASRGRVNRMLHALRPGPGL